MSWDGLALTVAAAGAFFFVACALLEGVLWLHDRWLDRRQPIEESVVEVLRRRGRWSWSAWAPDGHAAIGGTAMTKRGARRQARAAAAQLAEEVAMR